MRSFRSVVALAAVAVLVGCGVQAARAPRAIHWRSSESVGLPWHGRLVRGVQLPAAGAHFFTWDFVRKRSPSRGWRRWGSDRLVRTLLLVVGRYAAAHPGAPRVGIGDLSRPRGGLFGTRYGWPGHASHQNGLDVDVYYPRRDGRERPPASPRQIDRRLAQDLVDRFVAAGVSKVFVGPHTGLKGPPRVVQILPGFHDDHMHVRLPPERTRVLLGRSALGRPIRALAIVEPPVRSTVLVVGCIHGDECAGLAVTDRLVRARVPVGVALWVLPSLNPDGRRAARRQNGRGVDLNRNFPSEWERRGRPWGLEYSGPRPASEPETRIAMRLVRSLRPGVTIWFHQPQALVRALGRSVRAARRYARLAGLPFRRLRWPHGTAPNWQNHRMRGASFVVELPPGPLAPADARRQAAAVLRFALLGE